jgi:hypothetical protein
MAKVKKPLQEPPSELLQINTLQGYMLDVRNKVNSQGDAVADTTDVSDTATQLNALLAELRAAGFIAE